VIFLKNEHEEKKSLQNIFNKIKQKECIDVGDIVYGKVISVNEKMGFIDVDSVDGGKVLCPSNTGILFVNAIENGYVEKASDLIKKGDYIKARVMDANKFGLKLTTSDRNTGVIRAVCTSCKEPLKLNLASQELKCLKCRSIQTRKIAKM
jgi:exosome complex component CSL4